MNRSLPSGWEEVKLGDIADIVMGQSPKSKFYNKDNKGLPFLQGSSTFGYIYPTFNIYSSDIKKVAKSGSILMSVRAPVGDVNIANTNICIGRGLCAINSNNKSINNYIFYILKYYKNKLLNNQKGTTFGAITKDDIINFNIILPPIDEQKRISDILSICDKLIENLTKLIEKKELYKKGVMQKILSGKVRFNGFTDKWQSYKFEDIFIRVAAKKYQINQNEYKEIGKYPVIDQGKKYISAYSDNIDKVFNNDNVIAFGDHTRIFKYIDFNFIVGADGLQLLKTNKKFNTKFMYYHLSNQYIPNTGYNRHFKFILDMSFYIPPSIEEQKKIAELLTLIDKDIEILKQLLHLRKLQKKGVMQKLLTGEVRV
ncbi:restriction endonuclease subunit S [Brachyspira pilosicoli]|uniref:restriction endonuclease subunit S n=1 Tax=Brachyspira pilosicoli TaxID=52584 RepID=UPI003005CF58